MSSPADRVGTPGPEMARDGDTSSPMEEVGPAETLRVSESEDTLMSSSATLDSAQGQEMVEDTSPTVGVGPTETIAVAKTEEIETIDSPIASFNEAEQTGSVDGGGDDEQAIFDFLSGAQGDDTNTAATVKSDRLSSSPTPAHTRTRQDTNINISPDGDSGSWSSSSAQTRTRQDTNTVPSGDSGLWSLTPARTHIRQNTNIDADPNRESRSVSSSPASAPTRPEQEFDPYDLPLITRMDAQPGALADLPLGQQIQSVAESVGAELKAPLNGVDYQYHHPIWRPDPQLVTRDLFALHTQEDANSVISTIVWMNRETIRHIQFSKAKMVEEIKRQSCQIVHESTLPGADPAYIRAEVEKTVAVLKNHEDWDVVLAEEEKLSTLAIERMEIARKGIEEEKKAVAEGRVGWLAKEAVYAEFREKRVAMRAVVTRLHGLTGNADFLKRHKNELWDVVDRWVELGVVGVFGGGGGHGDNGGVSGALAAARFQRRRSVAWFGADECKGTHRVLQ